MDIRKVVKMFHYFPELTYESKLDVLMSLSYCEIVFLHYLYTGISASLRESLDELLLLGEQNAMFRSR